MGDTTPRPDPAVVQPDPNVSCRTLDSPRSPLSYDVVYCTFEVKCLTTHLNVFKCFLHIPFADLLNAVNLIFSSVLLRNVFVCVH